MPVKTISIKEINLDVYYIYESENDPFGTGDSPKAHYVEIQAVELVADTDDILPLLSSAVIDEIEQEIIDQENN
jgi:hypothetical protein